MKEFKMELLILDSDLESVGVLDMFESLIWTDRYSSYGDFEIYTSVTANTLSLLRQNYYLLLKESEHVMIIESVEIKSDTENGNKLLVKGRSLESILDRRVVWQQTILDGNFQEAIKQVLNENVINPDLATRKITRFTYEDSTDPLITNLTISAQCNGEFVYEVIRQLCVINNVGFKITLTNDNNFLFKLYSGVDRSYSQLANPYVVFSPEFDNIKNSNYFETGRGLKTVALVGGEGEGPSRKTIWVESSGEINSDLERREIFTDASNISQTIDGSLISDEEYETYLTEKGNEDLINNSSIQTFESEVDASQIFVYGRDFFIGDIMQIVNEYGIEGRVQVSELIFAQNASTTGIYPTFIMANN
jgi:hypothetical protein